jgi:methionyl-tRNA formyltransferase
MRIVFMGTPRAAVPTLRRCVEDCHEVVAVWTQPDRPSGRGHKLAQSPVKEFALAHNIPIRQPQRIKTDEAKQIFASHDVDVAIVVAYGRILPEEFLNTPTRGCINVHFSLLPKYRGAAPANWAIVNGEKETGVTTIGETETAPELMQRLSEAGAELLSETLAHLDVLTPRPQNHAEATFAPIIKKDDGLIDWTRPAEVIERAIRGFQPWPTAHTTFNEKGLTIWEAQALLTVSPLIQPGEVVVAYRDELVVQCGKQTALRVLEVQPEARKRLAARDFINGMHVKVGDRLGKT